MLSSTFKVHGSVTATLNFEEPSFENLHNVLAAKYDLTVQYDPFM